LTDLGKTLDRRERLSTDRESLSMTDGKSLEGREDLRTVLSGYAAILAERLCLSESALSRVGGYAAGGAASKMGSKGAESHRLSARIAA
jgi:hypothetical protein